MAAERVLETLDDRLLIQTIQIQVNNIRNDTRALKKRIQYKQDIPHLYLSNLRSFKGILQVYDPAHWVIRELAIYTLALRAA